MTIASLNLRNRASIAASGPRYTPGQDPAAPNLRIASIAAAFETIGFTQRLRDEIAKSRAAVAKALQGASNALRASFGRQASAPETLIATLGRLENATLARAQRHWSIAAASVQRLDGSLTARVRLLARQVSEVSEGSDLKRGLQYELEGARELLTAIESARELLTSAAADTIVRNVMVLRGEWGTGKTHSLCDLVRERMHARLPTLFILAQQLESKIDPLEAVVRLTKLATDSDDLLKKLQRLGTARQARTLIVIDGINEGDRDAWRRALPRIVNRMRPFTNVGLIISCREPFDKEVISPWVSKRTVSIRHSGFTNVEFDAQLAFFGYYGIPAPQFPLLSTEFSRPLFLQTLCKAIADLTRTSKHRQLRSFASGQRGMTYLLERFIVKAGAAVEDEFGLAPKTCWRILKGDGVTSNGPFDGIAPRMATAAADYVSRGDALAVVDQFVRAQNPTADGEDVLRRMLAEGLLAEDVRWTPDGSEPVIRCPFQRFSDHLIARHLLGKHLKTDSIASVRRSFYANRQLGKVFELWPGGTSFRMPGVASAVMLEFPERVAGKVPDDDRELVFYLPKRLRLVAPFTRVFLDGLNWRSAASFTTKTDALIALLLDPRHGSVNETLEVLVGLATRPEHPISADRLYSYLAKKTMPERDLSWTEYVRSAEDTSTIFKLLEWVETHAERGASEEAAASAMIVIALFQTTTRRPLRDRATRALVLLGQRFPEALFALTEKALAFNDPYVPERLLAASYGVAMRRWADPRSQHVRDALGPFARRLVGLMFARTAKHATAHIVMRDAAKGIIELAERVKPRSVPRRWPSYRRRRAGSVASVVPPGTVPTARERRETEPALQMDFDNYTLGHLVTGRQNYDSQHAGYIDMRNRLLVRMARLGYSNSRFGNLDRYLGERSWRVQANGEKTDRYGKKYSWIAYFELYGVESDAGNLTDWRADVRVPDIDCDPSFPSVSAQVQPPQLGNIFRGAPADPRGWLSGNRRPRYEHLLERTSIDGVRGRWVLLDGFVEQASSTDQRTVFAYLRGMLLAPQRLERFKKAILESQYLGNDQIPKAGEDHYTFAGEIPWSHRFGGYLRTGRGHAKRNIKHAFERYHFETRRTSGILVELPVHEFSWESYHSTMNQESGVYVPAPALCEACDLRSHNGGFDLFEPSGRLATKYVKWKDGGQPFTSHLLYIRRSLLVKYLRATEQQLVWAVWGERNFRGGSGFHQDEALSELWQSHSYVHRYLRVFRPRRN